MMSDSPRLSAPSGPSVFRRVVSAAPMGPRRGALTPPEAPTAKRERESERALGSEPPVDSEAPPSSTDDPPDRPFEVWRGMRGEGSPDRAFVSLDDALDYVQSRPGRRLDIRLPDGSWFSETTTIRPPGEKG